MAGTLFGLGLSQRVDSNGKPDAGWLLYIYDQNSSTPVTPYQDTGLTVTLPWPIEADASGMMPGFWLADGAYRARGTSNDGSRTFFDIQSMTALGPSAGSAPSGGVDQNAIFNTGDVLFMPISGTRTGWVRHNGRTIGSATSGASERANADCQALFEYLWNKYADAKCPVGGGRGGSAAADWAANKAIQTLDLRGKGPIGLDDMGNSAASRFTGVPFADGNETTAGSFCGENTHVLTKAEAPSGLITLNDPGHHHTLTAVSETSGGGTAAAGNAGSLSTSTNTTGITLTDNGSDDAHNNVAQSVTGTWYVRL